MRSIVDCEHDHPLRFAKHFFGSGFLRGDPWPQPELRTGMEPSSRGSRLACLDVIKKGLDRLEEFCKTL